MTPEDQAKRRAEAGQPVATFGFPQTPAPSERMTPEQKHRFTQHSRASNQLYDEFSDVLEEPDEAHPEWRARFGEYKNRRRALDSLFMRPGEVDLFGKEQERLFGSPGTITDAEYQQVVESPYGKSFGDYFASEKAVKARSATPPVAMPAPAPTPPPAQVVPQNPFLRELTSRTGLPAAWWTNQNLTAAARRKMVADLKRKK